MNDFKPGLEGVVAFQTEIAEPDRRRRSPVSRRGHRGARRAGPVRKGLGPPGGREPRAGHARSGAVRAGEPDGECALDLQAETARLSSVWNLQKLVDIEDLQARNDLARLSAQMMSIVAKSAAVHDGREPAPDDVVARARQLPRSSSCAGAGTLIRITSRRSTPTGLTAEHGLNASTFAARITASTGADAGAAMSAAVGALSGPPRRGTGPVLPMLDEVARTGIPRATSRISSTERTDHGLRPPRLRAEDPRSRILKRTAKESLAPRFEVAEALEELRWRSCATASPTT